MTPIRTLAPLFVFAGTLLAAAPACTGASTPDAPEAAAPAKPSPGAAPQRLVGERFATVNGLPVGTFAFEATAVRTPREGGWNDEARQESIDRTVDEELLFQEAFARGYHHDPKVRKIMMNLLLRDEIYEQVANKDFTDDELRAYFDEHAEAFVIPEKIQLRRIFIAVGEEGEDAALTEARALHEKLSANPDSFRDLATEQSDGPFASRGGEVGFIDASGKPGVPSEVVSRAFTLEVGTVGEPFMAAGGANILMVPSRRERVERTFEQMRGAVMRQMKNERYAELTEAFLTNLRGEADIQIDEAKAAELTLPDTKPGLVPPSVERKVEGHPDDVNEEHPMFGRGEDEDAE